MYGTLKCNKEYGQEIQNQKNTLDSHPNEETDQIVVYIPAAKALATAVVVGFVVKRKCKQATEETGCSSAYNSFIFQNQRDDGNVYEETPSVAVQSSLVTACSLWGRKLIF